MWWTLPRGRQKKTISYYSELRQKARLSAIESGQVWDFLESGVVTNVLRKIPSKQPLRQGSVEVNN